MKWKKIEVSALVDKHGYVRAIAYQELSGGKSIVGPLGTHLIPTDGYPNESSERRGRRQFMVERLKKAGYK